MAQSEMVDERRVTHRAEDEEREQRGQHAEDQGDAAAKLRKRGRGLKGEDLAQPPTIADYAVMHARGIPVFIYNTVSAEQAAYVAERCEATMAIVDQRGRGMISGLWG